VPGPIVIAGAAQVRIYYSQTAVRFINAVGAIGSPASNVNQALADALDAAIKSAFTSSGFAATVATALTLTQIGIRSLNAANLAEFLGTGAAVPGTGTGDPLSRSTSGVVTLRTALAGKSYRGRLYMPPQTEANNDTFGNQATAAGTAMNAYVTGIRNALAASGLTCAILSPALPERLNSAGQTLPAKPGFATAVVSNQVRNSNWGTQRRRVHRP
jgi:hypothetical protein